MKVNCKIVFIIFLLVSTVLYCLLRLNIKEENKIILVTYDRFLTLQDDGGTQYDRRYEIDFSKKTVTKLEDYYKGFEGLQYQNKKLYQKELTKKESDKLKELLKEISSKKNDYEQDLEHTYMYYELKQNNTNIKIYDKKVIQELEVLLRENENAIK